MKAITFDKMKNRKEVEIEAPSDTITHIMTDMNQSWEITFSLSMYDNKKRPIYTEKSRKRVETKLLPEG